MKVAGFIVLLLLLTPALTGAEDLSNNRLVQRYVNQLPRGLNSYTEFGHFFEELVAIDLKDKYPKSRYEVIQGIEYLDGPKSRRNPHNHRPGNVRAYGEIDFAVLDKQTDKFVEAGEIKCWRNLDDALVEAKGQLNRFKSHKSNGRIKDFLVIDSPKRVIKASQFEGTKFTTYGPKGARKYGFDHEIKLNKYEAGWIYNNHVKSKGYGFKASRKSPASPLNRAKQRVKSDVVRGGLLTDVAITAGIHIANKVGSGGSFKEGATAAWDYISSPVFFAGDLLGGCLGAALGSMIPIPAGLAASGLLGSMVSSFPTMAGAMVLANLGANAVSLLQKGEFSWSTLFKSVNWPVMSGQILGSVVGAALGSLIPIPYVGTIVGGVVGGLLGGKLAGLLFPSSVAAENSATEQAQKTTVTTITQEPIKASKASVSELSIRLKSAYEAVLSAKSQAERAAALSAYKEARQALSAAQGAKVAK